MDRRGRRDYGRGHFKYCRNQRPLGINPRGPQVILQNENRSRRSVPPRSNKQLLEYGSGLFASFATVAGLHNAT